MAAVEALKSAIAANDATAMTKAMEQLTQVQHKAAEAIYKTAGPSGGPGQPGGPGASQPGGGAGPTDDVIDAEVVDDDKK